jgi:FKBP-type peptidyl-prolyl cis-trans isomerase FklB
MKTKLAVAAILFTATLMLSGGALGQKSPEKQPENKSSAPTLDNQKAKASYAIGMTIGKNLVREGVDVDTDIFLRGLKDAIAGNKLLLTDDEAKSAIQSLQQEANEKQQARLKSQGEANKKEGEAFLAANKSKEGVVTLPSGLQYKIIKQGDGPKPVATDTVVCNYRGTLINGTEFDSSYKRGQPATFPVGGVIKGWTEILQLMPVGSHYQLFVPAELAYGSRPASAEIGPNSTLIFDVELLSIKEKPEAAKAPEPSKPAEPKK